MESGTRLFTEHGYEATSIEMVLHDTGVSRGALYHHFDGKASLFTAVLEATEARVAAVVGAAAATATGPLDALRTGCDAWLQLAANDAAIRRIVLIDAPTVVGWSAWRAIDDRYALGLLRAGLAAAAAAGRIAPEAVDVYAHLLLATLIESALLIARSDDPAATIALAQTAVGTILGALTS